MKYIVLSQDQKIIGFDHEEQAMEYCLEMDNHSLDEFCEEQQYTYETMTPTEIGQAYTEVGAVSGGCVIYETRSVLEAMKAGGATREEICEINELFNSKRFDNEVPCPGYLEDVLGELTPIHAAQLTDGIYFMENIDSSNEARDRG